MSNTGTLRMGRHPVFDGRLAPLMDDLPNAGRAGPVAHGGLLLRRNRSVGTVGCHPKDGTTRREAP
jgi:hypothetical protein